MFFTLDSSAKFIVSRRFWNFASTSDEISEQKLFRFSLQWHHCGQWEISKQLYWSIFWYDETEGWKGTVFHWSRCYVEFWSIVCLSVCCYHLFTSHLKYSLRRQAKNEERICVCSWCSLVYIQFCSGNTITVTVWSDTEFREVTKCVFTCCSWKTSC